MTLLIPREMIYLGKLEHSYGESVDFILESPQGYEGP